MLSGAHCQMGAIAVLSLLVEGALQVFIARGRLELQLVGHIAISKRFVTLAKLALPLVTN